ncbi:unnamed protein product [Periconia digitata]|uniref:Uncharacterized protein n=1 Tax=Periconia digitata TaxID=1303443 RepID=A0A9W4XMU8_9PLEO|nr:unnamed protein product [Periconia digitata]
MVFEHVDNPNVFENCLIRRERIHFRVHSHTHLESIVHYIFPTLKEEPPQKNPIFYIILFSPKTNHHPPLSPKNNNKEKKRKCHSPRTPKSSQHPHLSSKPSAP